MKSAIRDELVAVAKITQKAGESDLEFLVRLNGIISDDISDDEWAAVSSPAQDWNNLASDAIKANTLIPPFPDAVEDAPAPAPARRRGASTVPVDPVVAAFVPTVGAAVIVTTKKGKVHKGIIVELEDDGSVLMNPQGKDGDEDADVELAASQIGAIVADPEAAATPAAVEPEAEDDEAPAEPAVGDTVTVTTKKGKIKTGNVKSIDEEIIEITDATGEDHEFGMALVASVAVNVPAKKVEAPAPAPAPAGRRRGAQSAAEAPAPAPAAAPAPAPAEGRRRGSAKEPAADAERQRSPAGVGGRTRELIADSYIAGKPIAVDALEKALKAEGLEWRGATVSMNHRDSTMLLDRYIAGMKK